MTKHKELRTRLHEDVTWQPAREGAWNPCRDGDMVVRTLMWRAGFANRFRPGTTIDLGPRVVVQLRGKRMRRLGVRGYWGKLAQIIEVRNGKIVRIQDYPGLEEAMAAAGEYS